MNIVFMHEHYYGTSKKLMNEKIKKKWKNYSKRY